MPSLDLLIERMTYWCRDVSLGYSQPRRWNIRPGGDCDCSSLIIFTLREAGFDTGNATYTGNLSAELCARGWTRLPPDGHPQPGDILLNDRQHVALSLGNGLLAQASQSETNSIDGQPGDQTGRETNISNYYDYPWDAYLRYQQPTTQGEDIMISDEDAAKIAQQVWSYNWQSTATGGTTYNTIGAIYEKVKNLAGDVWAYSWNDSTTPFTELYATGDHTIAAEHKIDQIIATLTAQQAAITALASSIGADPATIADTIQQAVSDKLNQLHINITTDQ